jgi:polyferredoxin
MALPLLAGLAALVGLVWSMSYIIHWLSIVGAGLTLLAAYLYLLQADIVEKELHAAAVSVGLAVLVYKLLGWVLVAASASLVILVGIVLVIGGPTLLFALLNRLVLQE